MTVASSGYGAGSRDLGEFPNVLRMFLGTPFPASEIRAAGVSQRATQETLEPLLLLEANLDDMNPQLGAFFAERAFAAGALDVFFAPVQMKKNRPGLLLSVLCRPDLRDAIMDLFFAETTTLGVRSHEVLRRSLAREWVTVETPHGEVRVKVSRSNGRITNFAPEYEDCRRLAAQAGVPLKTVLQAAAFAFWKQAGS
jgi:uncharacterized protein (DUF111 family)